MLFSFFFLEEVAVLAGVLISCSCTGEEVADFEILALSGSFDKAGIPELNSAFESSLADMITCEIDRYEEKRYDHICS